MPFYSDLITQEGEFTYSVNIQFDMETDHKLLRFIPNEATTALLKEYFLDITRLTPEHHARIMYGSYGTGKSHLLTVLSMLLSKSFTDGLAFASFIERLRRIDSALASDIESFERDNSRKPFLVVPIAFDFADFDRCIYFSLKRKLESLHISVEFKTFYDQAAQLIAQWRSTEQSEERLKEACRNVGIKLASLEKMLSRYDKQAEGRFQRLFSEMTYGVPFIYEVSNLADAINQANDAISENYSGIIFVFDEFGSYIEDNIKNVKVKSVQDLAEICDHTNGNNHIILVSHKEISQYTQRLGKSISAEWKKVEGRYKATSIADKEDQVLSLVGNVISKNPGLWQAYRDRFSSELMSIYSDAAEFHGFLVDVSNQENPFEAGFPIHPIALYALDKLSKKVAQNERTFFTYLASKEANSLYSFLADHNLEEFHFVGIDDIYDYFEPNITAVQSDSSFEWYKNLQRALAKNNSVDNANSPECRILKAIATIGIINDSSTLTADKETILKVIDLPKETIASSLSELCAKKIIKFSGAYNRYEFFEASIFDIEELISEGSRQIDEKAIVSTLNESFLDYVLYPYRYNREYKINRLFIPTYCLPDELLKKAFVNRFGEYYDGILAILLTDDDAEVSAIIERSSALERTIIIVHQETAELKDAVKRYIAIQYLGSTKEKYVSQDPAFENELQYYEFEVSATIREILAEWKQDFSDTIVVSEGETRSNARSMVDISNLASDILTRSYSRTLIVNNELINKNNISGSIMSAKRNVLNGILADNNPQNYYGVQYLSPDYIAIRSVLAKNGYIEFENENEAIVENALPSGDHPQTAIARYLNGYIRKAQSGQVEFVDIYSGLKKPPYGLRDGYLSLLFAHFLGQYKKSLIISSHGVEQELSPELFEEIVRRPHDYSFSIASWTKTQLDYFEALAHLFSDYINESSYNKNRIKAIYDAMLSHYKSITKYARTTEQNVSKEAAAYRKLMAQSTTNYSGFLLNSLDTIEKRLENRVDVINRIKKELENLPQNVARDIASQIQYSFGSASVPLGQMFKAKYDSEWKGKRQKSFDYYTNAFLEYVSNIDIQASDYQIISSLSKILSGLELEFWNDKHQSDLLERLSEIKAKLDSYHEGGALADAELKMTLSTSGGQEKSVIFSAVELSSLGKTVKNKINSTFGNYGLSISYDEKVQIILSILDDLLEGK